MQRAGAAAALLVVLAAPVVPAAQQGSIATLIERAGAYVEQYQRDLAMIVAEERYEQEVRYPGLGSARGSDLSTHTVLRSDFLLIRNDARGWVPFRDVFERDGTAVRDRDERLAQLFLSDTGTAADQARRITQESARYNVGSLTRNINVPTLPLVFLTDEQRSGFSFRDLGRDDGVRLVRFSEDQRPTFISTTNGRSLPASGRFWIDEATGRVERTELIANDEELDAKITVTYRDDATAGLWVPARMEELYKQRGDRSEIRGVATYSRHRRFQIRTTEDLAK